MSRGKGGFTFARTRCQASLTGISSSVPGAPRHYLTASRKKPEDQAALLLGGTMRLAIAALAAALLVGAASAQEPGAAGTRGDTNAPAADGGRAKGGLGINISPDTRKRLLQGLVNAIAPRRPAVATAAPTAEPVVTAEPAAPPTPAPGEVAVISTPPPPRPAIGAVIDPAASIPVRLARRKSQSRGDDQAGRGHRAAKPTPVRRRSAAPAINRAWSGAEMPLAVAPAPPPVAQPTKAIFGSSTMVLLGLLAALAALAAAIAIRAHRSRRIQRTRAAVLISPRIDLSAGATVIRFAG